ncbi:MAG: pentapeptide repeat-containing protein [Acidimicrobiales bacterium]
MLDGAVLDGAVLDGAVLDGAVLDGAVLDGAVLDGTVLGAADVVPVGEDVTATPEGSSSRKVLSALRAAAGGRGTGLPLGRKAMVII